MLTLCGRPIHCRCMIMQRRYSTAAEIWINHQLVVEGSGPREPWCGRLTCEIALRRTDRRRGSGRRSGRLGMRGVASGTQVQAYGFVRHEARGIEWRRATFAVVLSQRRE